MYAPHVMLLCYAIESAFCGECRGDRERRTGTGCCTPPTISILSIHPSSRALYGWVQILRQKRCQGLQRDMITVINWEWKPRRAVWIQITGLSSLSLWVRGEGRLRAGREGNTERLPWFPLHRHRHGWLAFQLNPGNDSPTYRSLNGGAQVGNMHFKDNFAPL